MARCTPFSWLTFTGTERRRFPTAGGFFIDHGVKTEGPRFALGRAGRSQKVGGTRRSPVP